MKLGVCIWSGLHWTHSSVQLKGTEHKDSRPCFLFFLWLKFRKPKERDTGGKQIWSKAMLCIGWETITGRKSGVFSPSLKFYFLRSLVVGCIFDTNDNISRYTKKRGRVCLLLEGLVFWFFFFFCSGNKIHCVSLTAASVSLVPHIQACNFNNRQSPAVNVYNRTRADRWASFSHLQSVYPGRRGWALLQSAVEQTTVRPPGHQWTGTNHQSEWLLMELEQLPQTIKKGRNDINSDVLKGGVGGGAADAKGVH